MQRDHTLAERFHSDVERGLLLISVVVGKRGCVVCVFLTQFGARVHTAE